MTTTMNLPEVNLPEATAWSGGADRARAPLARRLRRILTLAAVATIVVAVLPRLAIEAGYQPLVVQSGSMAPALRTGDAVISRVVGPSAVDAGDVVTFVDSTRGDRLVTHRVVEVRRQGDQYSFVTKGDSNSGVERWDIAENDSLGRLTLRIPKLGFVVAVTSAPAWRALLGALAIGMLTVTAVRRIWS